VRSALDEARRVGVRSMEDMAGGAAATRRVLFRLYQRLARAGQMTARVDLRWPLGEWQELARLAVQADFGNEFVRIGGVKGFVDGSLGSSTAKMVEPVLNEPGRTGVFVAPRGKLQGWIIGGDQGRV